MLSGTLVFLGIFSAIVIIHELGHFIAAKIFKINVIEFSLGFGNKLCSAKDRSNTSWNIRTIPFGGYVALDDASPTNSLSRAAYWKKAVIFLAGPLANIATALVLAMGITYFYGYRPESLAVIQTSSVQSVKQGDQIIAVDGQSVYTWRETVRELMGKKDAEIKLVDESGVARTEKIEKTGKTWDMVPVRAEFIKVNLKTAVMHGFTVVMDQIQEFFMVLISLFTKGIYVLSGPIGIAKATMRTSSLYELLDLVIRLSMSLALFNLLPFPGLDGGQILITSLRLSDKWVRVWSYGGLGLLGLLMILVSIGDLFK